MPGVKQAWPNSAACWSPAIPPICRLPPRCCGSVSPKTSLDGRTSGSIARGTSRAPASSSSQSPVWMLKSIVREALVTSVTCSLPPVSFQISQRVDGAEGQLAILRELARAGHVVEDPLDLGAGEVGVDDQPGLCRTSRLGALFAQRRADARERRSCQTIALWIGRPVLRSQTSVVSRWLVMPMPRCRRADGVLRQDASRRRRAARSRSPRGRAPPSRAADRSGGTPPAPGRRCCPAGRRRCCVNSRCPGPVPAGTS